MENPQHALIEQYLDGSLTPEAQADFEAQLKSDSDLARELRLHEAARAAVEVQSMLDRRNTLQQRGQQKLFWRKWWWKTQDALEQIFVQQRPDGSRRMRMGLITGVGLATALLLIYLVNPGLFFPDSTNFTPKPMAIPKEQAVIAFNKYFKPVEITNTLGAADVDTLYRLARNQYAQGDCDAALTNLETLLVDTAFDDRAQALLLKGTCLLDKGDTQAARESLQFIPITAAIPHKNAQWYIALCYLKEEESEKASEILREIADDKRHPYQADARAMLGMDI